MGAGQEKKEAHALIMDKLGFKHSQRGGRKGETKTRIIA